MQAKKRVLVTGGAGFIGSNFVLEWLAAEGSTLVVNLDKVTYAANPDNLSSIAADSRHIFVRGDIGDRALVRQLLSTYRPQAVINFAAESHVDRSILGPEEFLNTNVLGTQRLLDEVRLYHGGLSESEKHVFRFLHVSTDEVYGSLGPNDPAFTEATPYAPNSPYAASKAASDHVVRAYHHTYGLPTLITNCSNNYGPFQFPEKLIPLMVLNAVQGKPLPIYGDGLNIRDWLYVKDHYRAIVAALDRGRPGEAYNIGGNSEKTNLQIVKAICTILDELRPNPGIGKHETLITYVKDRPGHDRRYAINATKAKRELNWNPEQEFDAGLRKTVEWYVGNMEWVLSVTSGEYRKWIDRNYNERAAV